MQSVSYGKSGVAVHAMKEKEKYTLKMMSGEKSSEAASTIYYFDEDAQEIKPIPKFHAEKVFFFASQTSKFCACCVLLKIEF